MCTAILVLTAELMALRLHSCDTLVQGMEAVSYGGEKMARKRELEEKIRVAWL